LEIVVAELNQIKREHTEKEIHKQARANRKRLPKRDPMTAEIYKELIKEAEGPTYLHVRLRLAICLLSVTGVPMMMEFPTTPTFWFAAAVKERAFANVAIKSSAEPIVFVETR
jgi:hypothetical protein